MSWIWKIVSHLCFWFLCGQFLRSIRHGVSWNQAINSAWNYFQTEFRIFDFWCQSVQAFLKNIPQRKKVHKSNLLALRFLIREKVWINDRIAKSTATRVLASGEKFLVYHMKNNCEKVFFLKIMIENACLLGT